MLTAQTPTRRSLRATASAAATPRQKVVVISGRSDGVSDCSDDDSECSDKNFGGGEEEEDDEDESESEDESEEEDHEEEEEEDGDEQETTERRKRRSPARQPTRRRPPKRARILPLLPKREAARAPPPTDLARARELLHVSHVPDALPCREDQFEDIYSYLASAVEKGGGECLYISGVPGTGKTATVRQVIKTLQDQVAEESIPPFRFIEINGMKLTDPNQAYCAFWEALFPESPKVSPKHACDLLQEFFGVGNGGTAGASTKKKGKAGKDLFDKKNVVPIILMVDELDLLLTSKQTVIYNFFNWPRIPSSPLILIAIANTMDLPERVFSHKINSRVGGSRLGFNAYTAAELAQIIESRVGGGGAIHPDAITFCTKKVAGMSGDARRALDICRKAIESLESTCSSKDAEKASKYISKETGRPQVDRKLISDVIRDLFSPTVVPFITNSSVHQKLFLLAIRKSMRKTGDLDATFESVVDEHKAYCQPLSIPFPTTHLLEKVALQLFETRCILMETGKFMDPNQKVKLNVSEGDMLLALKDDAICKKILAKEV
ncbi:P-loop containing nucleoside triphosphate hydrolase protein, partial [Obelidium mucronatum]